MSNDLPARQLPTKKPFYKMQIEKVNLRTSETMGNGCQRWSSTTSFNPGFPCTDLGGSTTHCDIYVP